MKMREKLERTAEDFGMNFGLEFFWGGGGVETLEKQSRNIPGKKSLRNLQAMFPKVRQATIKSSPQIHSADPQDQEIAVR